MLKVCYKAHILLVAIICTVLAACSEQDGPLSSGKKHESVDPALYSDFSTMMACPVTIYFDRQTLVKVYDVDPDLNPDAEHIYSAFTDLHGTYIGTMQIPSAYIGRTLWARGFGFEDSAVVTRKGVVFSSRFGYSRAGEVTEISHMYDDEELEQECHRLYGKFLDMLPENHNNTSRLSETKNLAIYTIKDNTEIAFSFVNSGGRYLSQLYYFYFPQEVSAIDFIKDRLKAKGVADGKTPEEEDLNIRTEFMRFFTNDAPDPDKKFLLTRDWSVFYTDRKQYAPLSYSSHSGDKWIVTDTEGNRLIGNGIIDAPLSMSDAQVQEAKDNNVIVDGDKDHWPIWNYGGYGFINRNFNNQVGAHHHLRFYGPNYDEYLDTPNYRFPKGYRIGFILKVKNHDNGHLHLFTTNNDINKNGNIQCARYLSVATKDTERGITNIVYGYEDQIIDEINSSAEPDYNDFMFLISTSPVVSTVGMDTMHDKGTMMIGGTLLYEDLYPEPGDYDMNDVMVEYEMWVNFNEDNYVTSIDARFWPTNYGATYDDDFFIELTTDNNGTRRQWLEPQKIATAGQLRSMSAANLADINAGHVPSHAIERIFTFDPKQKLHKDQITIENLNPFIFVNNTNREVHLTNQRFCGVPGATEHGLTEGERHYYPLMIHDGSIIDGCYFPYAMNVPRRFSGLSHEGFTPVTERVYIVLEYQQFLDWMRNPNDDTYKAWYNSYRKWTGN